MPFVREMRTLVLVQESGCGNGDSSGAASIARGTVVARKVTDVLQRKDRSYVLLHTPFGSAAQHTAQVFAGESKLCTPTFVSTLGLQDHEGEGDIPRVACGVLDHILCHRTVCDVMIMVLDQHMLEVVLKKLLHAHQLEDPPARAKLRGGEAYLVSLPDCAITAVCE